MRWRRLLWICAVILFGVAAVLAYSPNPRLARHIRPATLAAWAAFICGWAVGPTADL